MFIKNKNLINPKKMNICKKEVKLKNRVNIDTGIIKIILAVSIGI
jgi:hypothetical protein